MPLVCVGDINRMKTQLKRAGGTVCFSDIGAWRAFNAAVEKIEHCNYDEDNNKSESKRKRKKNSRRRRYRGGNGTF